jgi:hypothetical protein
MFGLLSTSVMRPLSGSLKQIQMYSFAAIWAAIAAAASIQPVAKMPQLNGFNDHNGLGVGVLIGHRQVEFG